LLYGDSYLPVSISWIWQRFLASDTPALMTVLRNDGCWDQSNVDFAEGRVRRYDKLSPDETMRFIDYGLSAFQRCVIEEIPSGVKFDLAQLFYELSTSGRLAGLEVHERFYEVGSPTGLADFEALLGRRAVDDA
jgi:N-acetyl-alpha-D-muramate 1-phosphate uridylyltransferase